MIDLTAEFGPRERIMESAIRCAERQGVRGFSLEDVATEASVSRTTIYRYFPQGRAELLTETIMWEVSRFWSRLADAIAPLPTLEDRLVAGLMIGRKLMSKSRILANLADPDLKELIEAAQPTESLVHGVIRDYMQTQISQEREAGRFTSSIDDSFAADYLARMALSWMGNSPGMDYTDEAVRRIVTTQFLGGLY